jgi:hypothetical protein
MLKQFEIVELDVIDHALASMPRHPRVAWPPARELQYRCNRCLCWRFRIVTHFLSQTVVSWCQSPIISETTSDSSHLRLKLTTRNALNVPLRLSMKTPLVD